MPRRSRSRSTAVAALSALALTACSGGSSPTVAGASSPAGSVPAMSTTGTPVTGDATSAPAPASPGTATAVTTAPATTAPTAGGSGAAAVLLVLEPDGLGLATGASIRQLPFGSDVVTVTNALTRTIGPVTRTPQPECGQGPRVQVSGQGFSALFDGTKLVGWLDSGRTKAPLTTANGIGVGSTLARVRSSFAGVTVTTDSLGPEWTTADESFGGLLDGTAGTSRMTDFFAGETCFFR